MVERVSKYNFKKFFGKLLDPDPLEKIKNRKRKALTKKQIKIRNCVYKQRYYWKNRDEIVAKQAILNKKNSEKRPKLKNKQLFKVDSSLPNYKSVYTSEWINHNRERVNRVKAEWINEQINKLTDHYIIFLLTRKGPSRKPKFLSREEAMRNQKEIEIKRAEVLINRIERKIKNLENEKVSNRLSLRVVG